jgi:hypothetical protein
MGRKRGELPALGVILMDTQSLHSDLNTQLYESTRQIRFTHMHTAWLLSSLTVSLCHQEHPALHHRHECLVSDVADYA